MTSFELIVIVFGSTKSVSNVNLRFPISFVFATDESSLENLITTDPPSFDTCLRRYFVLLLDTITDQFFDCLHMNHHVQIVYSQNNFIHAQNRQKLRLIRNKQWQQVTLDLTSDIVNFLTVEGEKQAKLEQISLAQVYYRQARSLKEWAMSFVKAEPCHILLIPLNSSEDNVNNTYKDLHRICAELGYPSIIVRKLDEYIPIGDIEKPSLMPYSSALFHNEHPNYICKLIKNLSPLRFYLYGNEDCIASGWSNLMIAGEVQVMDDEDNWCAFLENEPIDNEIKWNFGTMFGEKWQVNRITPICLTDLNGSLRFQSALRRAVKTISQHQIEVTSLIFEWYDKCIRDGHLQLEPKLTSQDEDKITRTKIEAGRIFYECRFQYLSTLPQVRLTSNMKGDSFIWLGEILNHPNKNLDETIAPSKWNIFNEISICIPYIEIQLREEKRIFLVVSGSLGHTLFITSFHLMSLIPYIYIYCSSFDLYVNWANYYSGIRGVHANARELGKQINQDLNKFYPFRPATNNHQYTSKVQYQDYFQNHNSTSTTSLSSWFVFYNPEQSHIFLAHQREIDTLLCMPHTTQSRDEMLIEFRRICKDDNRALNEINRLEKEYDSKDAVYWYSREYFLYRIINQALRNNDVESMFKMRYFLTDLYAQLTELCTQDHVQKLFDQRNGIMVYRGQQMTKAELEYFRTIQGCIIATKPFLSATRSFAVASLFAATSEGPDITQVIFCIKIDRFYENFRPFAYISQAAFMPEEEEVLFSMGSLFRVQSIETLITEENISVINLTLVEPSELAKNNFFINNPIQWSTNQY
ncbi:unnamed protein product [Rotaria socialis]|uniref:NAD(P)(+)--arginine ADP-ribosyltransferase n=2 Tax=Rotaria socialis TaxID=392032 RepID=A0A818Z3F3_9BILA|nr:unnamed protein product [Rotaria socialis]CAF4431443.1 unnamed protein product [Rotaria socialis]